MTEEVRCPDCRKLILSVSDDFAGQVSGFCSRCKLDVGYPKADVIPTQRIECSCGKWIASGSIIVGQIRAKCKRDRVLVVFTPEGAYPAERPVQPITAKPPAARRQRPNFAPPIDYNTTVVQMIEERWRTMRQLQVRKSVEIAVGLRFDVFSRDGFRCRYCGRGPAQGVFLEADHVIPRSAGGPDSMANLVTACWDCNRGKAAKAIAS